MRNTLLLTTFLVSILYYTPLYADDSYSTNSKIVIENLELPPLLEIKDKLTPLAVDGIPVVGVIQDPQENNDDNLTADSEPLGGYRDSSESHAYPTDLEEFKKKQEVFKKLLQEIKDEKSGKVVGSKAKPSDYTGEDEIELINRKDPETHLTPLNLALDVLADPKIVEWLIQSGVKLPDDMDISSDSAIDHAIEAWRNIELFKDKEKAKEIYFKNIKLLLDSGVKPDGLWPAMYVKQYEIINYLLDNRYVKPTQQDLENACEYLNWEMIQKILNTGLDINALGYSTPLMVAVENNRLDIVEKLLEAGADPNKKSYLSKYSLRKLTSPLEAAIFGSSIRHYENPPIDGDLRIVRALLKAVQSQNLLQKIGTTFVNPIIKVIKF